MPTEVLSADNPQAIARAAEVIRGGGLVAFPTETVYGLGANALDADAVARIFAAKGRPATNPLIVHLADASWATRVTPSWPEQANRLAERFWPGPLTLVLAKGDQVPEIVTAGGPTVAVRVPQHKVAEALLRAANLPIAAPSANRSTRLSATTAEHVLRSLDGRIDLILDGGPATAGLESTVVDLTTNPPRVLRPGPISASMLAEVVGPVELATSTGNGIARSPGMMLKHYAPKTRLECAAVAGGIRVGQLTAAGQRVGWLTLTEPASSMPGVEVRVLSQDPATYAARLYATLHELDELGLDTIVVDLPPDTEAWLAPRDRLRRAATDLA